MVLNFNRLKSSKEEMTFKNPEVLKEKWFRLGKNRQKIDRNSESSVFHDVLFDKCWPDQHLPFMHFNIDLDVISDDNIEFNLYPLLQILENQRVRNQNDETVIESDKQEVILFMDNQSFIHF